MSDEKIGCIEWDYQGWDTYNVRQSTMPIFLMTHLNPKRCPNDKFVVVGRHYFTKEQALALSTKLTDLADQID